MPEPISHYTTTDTIVPEPEFHVYKDQADDLDEINARISKLTSALKRRGVYDQSVKELSRLATAGDNQFIPCDNYAALASKGGLAAAFQTEDVSLIANVLVQLYQQREMLVKAIWEIVGIADIQRGTTNPSETYGAQKMKAQFGGQRMQKRQRAIQKWVSQLLKLKAEIIAEHFEPERLEAITGVTIIPPEPPITGDPMQDQQVQHNYRMAQQQAQQMLQVMRTDKLRSYRIEVETDSTVFEDAEAEKRSRGEMITAITQFIGGWAPIVQGQPAMGEIAFELLKFGVGGFKSTRAIDDAIEKAASQLAGEARQPQALTPEQEKAQADVQAKQMEIQMKGQMEQQKLQAKLQAEGQKAQMDQQRMAVEMQYKMQELELKMRQLEAQLEFKNRELQIKAADQMQQHAMRQRDAALDQAMRQPPGF